MESRSPINHEPIRALHRAAGNRAVAALLRDAQAKTEVGPVADPLEQQADVVARRVVQSVMGTSAPGVLDPPRTAGVPGAAATAQRTAEVDADGGTLDGNNDRLLRSARHGGIALDPVLQRTLEEAMGADLSAVRLHDGPIARDLSSRIQAKAFTVGGDVFFRDGLPDTSHATGLGLLAHELAHTVQQGASTLPPAGALVQRSPESAAKLKELAEPKVFQLEGAEIGVQKEIVRQLEEQQLSQPIYCVGAMVIDRLASLPEMLAKVEFLDLRSTAYVKDFSPRSAGVLLPNPLSLDVQRLVVNNTLTTMKKAGQLDYLELSRLVDDDWVVFIEIHYYRDRSPSQQGFHKDTRGQTLFVSLSFLNDEEMAGPEYIVNPTTKGDTRDLTRSLPAVFVEDVGATRNSLSVPDRVEATRIKPHGVVSFVDEAIHHKTPTIGRRTVPASEVVTALAETYPKLSQGYDSYGQRWMPWPYLTYFEAGDRKQAEAYYAVVSELKAKGDTYLDRTDLAALLDDHPLIRLDVDELIDTKARVPSQNDTPRLFGEVNVPNVASNFAVRTEGRPPLKRTMSDWALLKQLPKNDPDKKRTFFRTWVRAVPRRTLDAYRKAVAKAT